MTSQKLRKMDEAYILITRTAAAEAAALKMMKEEAVTRKPFVKILVSKNAEFLAVVGKARTVRVAINKVESELAAAKLLEKKENSVRSTRYRK